ncbi:MAG: ATP-binding protein [Methylocystaceae bacterium]|nr:MAG: ATP-binding protein [Methylocystaceae bacterium]
MDTIEIAPAASALLGSLRGLGYSPETALADLVDNSISAQARFIQLSIDWNDGAPRIGVLDDGLGMSPTELEAAMRFGGDASLERASDDLGRFGLGLKTASLSQCRRLTVISRRSGETSSLSWDVDEVIATGRWTARVGLLPQGFDHLKDMDLQVSGTLVVLEHMDEIGGLHGLDKERFFAKVKDIRDHFAMVFHRFLYLDARRIRIRLNGRNVEGWDPMLRSHPATQMLGADRIGSGAQAVMVTPFVLPHRDRFANEAEFQAAAGPGGWAERQGFYIYRAKRLVMAGSWLGLGSLREWTKEESSRLARIAVDLPQSMDAAWRIDVRKARARPPAALRNRLVTIGSACRDRAREVFAWRGSPVRTGRTSRDVSPVWSEEHVSGKRRYRINREHPVIQALLDGDGDTARLARAAFSLVERSVPIERIWLDVSENTEALPPTEPLDPATVEDLATALRALGAGTGIEDTLDGLLRGMRLTAPEMRAAVLRRLGELA